MKGQHGFAGVALAAALALAGCGSGPDVRDFGTRAMVIGIDGADWKIIDALAAEGAMPHLSRLRSQGVSGPIETLNDIPLSPVVWTSVATGKTAAKHGIAWFMVDQPDGTRVPVRSHNRKAKAIWNILAESGRRANVVGWWASYPAEDIRRGTLISDALGFHGFGATAREGQTEKMTYPESLFERMNALVPAEQQVSADFVRRFIHISPEEYRNEMFDPARFPQRDPFNPIHLFQEYAVTAQGYTAIAEDLLENRPYDLFMVYFEQVDSFSHLFMKYDPPRLSWIDEEGFARYHDVVREWYRYQDELLGRVLERVDLKETAVFVLSDHGFKSGERRIRSEETVDVKKAHLDHEIHGIFLAAGPHLVRGQEVEGASVLDITPTLLHYLGFPVAKDMDGKVLEGVFERKWIAEHPIRYIATYEEEDRSKEPEGGAESDAGEDWHQTEDALRALGYLGESPQGGASSKDVAAKGEASSPEIHNNLGRIHLRNGETAKARQEFAEALALDPRNAEALLNLGSIHRAEGRIAQAEHFVERALQVDPNSIAALSQLGEIKRDQNELAEAIRLFREAIAIDDSQPFVLLGLGDVLQRAGRYQEAERAFRSVLELEPDSFKARYNLGVTYGNQGRVDEAIKMYEEALKLSPNDPEAAKALNNLGSLHLSRNEVEQATERFEEAVKASTVHLESRYNLASLYLGADRVDEAIKLLEEAAAVEPNHELVNVALGMAYLRKGRHEDAFRSFLLVRRLYPRNWVAPLGMALLHAASNQKEQARKLLGEALALGGEAARVQAASYPVLAGLVEEPSPK